MREVPPGEVGEIAIRSPGNMTGYWNLPELTSQVLRSGWVLFPATLVGRMRQATYSSSIVRTTRS